MECIGQKQVGHRLESDCDVGRRKCDKPDHPLKGANIEVRHDKARNALCQVMRLNTAPTKGIRS